MILRQFGDERGHVTFTTGPLAHDEVLAGHACLAFRTTLDAADAHYYVELLDVDEDGTETLVNDGYLKASHRVTHRADARPRG
jgi:predicted acyl esterase